MRRSATARIRAVTLAQSSRGESFFGRACTRGEDVREAQVVLPRGLFRLVEAGLLGAAPGERGAVS